MVDELEKAFAEAEGKSQIHPIIATIIYKLGPSVPMIAEWISKREVTVYR